MRYLAYTKVLIQQLKLWNWYQSSSLISSFLRRTDSWWAYKEVIIVDYNRVTETRTCYHNWCSIWWGMVLTIARFSFINGFLWIAHGLSTITESYKKIHQKLSCIEVHSLKPLSLLFSNEKVLNQNFDYLSIPSER